MEYEDFLTHWEVVERTQVFDPTWIQSSHWLEVSGRPSLTAVQYGDVSFKFSLPTKSDTILIMSQSDDRFYKSVSSSTTWSFDFKLFKANDPSNAGPLASSDFSYFLNRSNTLRIELEAGDYIVHVRLDRDTDPGKRDGFAGRVSSFETRKMSRVLSELARSKSIAANFDTKRWANHLVVPVEVLGGRDINQIQTEHIEEESKRRKTLQARFSVMRDIVATPAPCHGDGGEDAEDNALEKAGAELASSGETTAAKPDTPASVVVDTTEVSTTISSTTLRIDLPTPPSSGGSEAVVVNDASEKPKVNGQDKHKLAGHGCGEDDGDEKKDDEASNYADAEEDAKPDDAEKKPDGDADKKPDEDAKSPVEADTADDPPPVPLSPQEMPAGMSMGLVEEQAGPEHYVFCDGCKNGVNIVGVRWKCLECEDYDLCDKCHRTGAHDEHEMLRIEHPDDYQSVELAPLVDDADSLLLGLRVYTNQDAPVKISGQLCRGQLMRWKKSL